MGNVVLSVLGTKIWRGKLYDDEYAVSFDGIF